jgi:hypothetical protein
VSDGNQERVVGIIRAVTSATVLDFDDDASKLTYLAVQKQNSKQGIIFAALSFISN